MANPNGKGGFQPGQSGNPNGRPKKKKALTEILRKAGGKTMEWEGSRISGRRWMACKLWEIVKTGKATFPGEIESKPKVMIVSPKDWIGVAQWIYNRVDGPPVAEFDIVTTGRQSVPDDETLAQALAILNGEADSGEGGGST